jgi:hypothetical protein
MAIEKMSLRQRMGNFLRGSTFAVKIGVPVLGGVSLVGGCSVKLQGNEMTVPSGQSWEVVAKLKLGEKEFGGICGVPASVLVDPKNIEMVKRAADKLKSANGNVELPDDAFGSFAEGWFGVNVPKGYELVRIPASICAGIGGTPTACEPPVCESAVKDMGPLGEVEWGMTNQKLDVKGDFKITSSSDKVAVRYDECGILIDFEIKGGKLVSITVDSKNAVRTGKNYSFVLVDGDVRTFLGTIKVKEAPPPPPPKGHGTRRDHDWKKVPPPQSGIPEPPKAREIKE